MAVEDPSLGCELRGHSFLYRSVLVSRYNTFFHYLLEYLFPNARRLVCIPIKVLLMCAFSLIWQFGVASFLSAKLLLYRHPIQAADERTLHDSTLQPNASMYIRFGPIG